MSANHSNGLSRKSQGANPTRNTEQAPGMSREEFNRLSFIVKEGAGSHYLRVRFDFLSACKGDWGQPVLLAYLLNLCSMKLDNRRDREKLWQDEGWFLCPMNQMVKHLGAERHRLRRILNRLEAAGFIETEHRWGRNLWVRINEQRLVESAEQDRGRLDPSEDEGISEGGDDSGGNEAHPRWERRAPTDGNEAHPPAGARRSHLNIAKKLSKKEAKKRLTNESAAGPPTGHREKLPEEPETAHTNGTANGNGSHLRHPGGAPAAPDPPEDDYQKDRRGSKRRNDWGRRRAFEEGSAGAREEAEPFRRLSKLLHQAYLDKGKFRQVPWNHPAAVRKLRRLAERVGDLGRLERAIEFYRGYPIRSSDGLLIITCVEKLEKCLTWIEGTRRQVDKKVGRTDHAFEAEVEAAERRERRERERVIY